MSASSGSALSSWVQSRRSRRIDRHKSEARDGAVVYCALLCLYRHELVDDDVAIRQYAIVQYLRCLETGVETGADYPEGCNNKADVIERIRQEVADVGGAVNGFVFPFILPPYGVTRREKRVPPPMKWQRRLECFRKGREAQWGYLVDQAVAQLLTMERVGGDWRGFVRRVFTAWRGFADMPCLRPAPPADHTINDPSGEEGDFRVVGGQVDAALDAARAMGVPLGPDEGAEIGGALRPHLAAVPTDIEQKESDDRGSSKVGPLSVITGDSPP